jgi:hypothetical protein
MLEIMRAASTTYDDLWKWNTLERRSQSYTLGFSHKSPSMGEDGANLTTCSTHTKDHVGKKMNNDVSSTLLKKREKREYREKEERKSILLS